MSKIHFQSTLKYKVFSDYNISKKNSSNSWKIVNKSVLISCELYISCEMKIHLIGQKYINILLFTWPTSILKSYTSIFARL